MAKPPQKGKPPSCQVKVTATVRFNGKNMRAQQLLDLGSKQILDFTEESLTLPPICCAPTYVPRAAFEGDDVGVPLADRAAALAENAAAAANYSTNSTKSIPYGVCKTAYRWRQASMAVTSA